MKPGKTTEITVLEEEISQIDEKIKFTEQKRDKAGKKVSPFEWAKYSLPTIAKCDPLLNLDKVSFLIDKKIQSKREQIKKMDKSIHKMQSMHHWLNHVRLAKEGRYFKSEEEKPLEEVKEFKSLWVKPGKYEKEQWSLEKINHPKYPGIEYNEVGFRYRKQWLFIISSESVVMHYIVHDENGPDDEEHIYHSPAKEKIDNTPPMIEVLKKMDELLQK